MKVVLIWLAILCGACGPAPFRMLDRAQIPEEAAVAQKKLDDVPIKGAQARLFYLVDAVGYWSGETTTSEHSKRGELLSVEKDFVCLATPELFCVSSADVQRIKIEIRPAHGGAAGVITFVGTLSSLSHGFYALFTMPGWLVLALPMAINEGAQNDIYVGEPNIWAAFQFARYPGGLPPSMKQLREGKSGEEEYRMTPMTHLPKTPVESTRPIEAEPVEFEEPPTGKPSVIGEMPEP